MAEVFNPWLYGTTKIKFLRLFVRELCSLNHGQTTDQQLSISGRVTTCSNLLFYNAGARTQTFRTLGVRTPP